jgi:hypothetical protein
MMRYIRTSIALVHSAPLDYLWAGLSICDASLYREGGLRICPRATVGPWRNEVYPQIYKMTGKQNCYAQHRRCCSIITANFERTSTVSHRVHASQLFSRIYIKINQLDQGIYVSKAFIFTITGYKRSRMP